MHTDEFCTFPMVKHNLPSVNSCTKNRGRRCRAALAGRKEERSTAVNRFYHRNDRKNDNKSQSEIHLVQRGHLATEDKTLVVFLVKENIGRLLSIYGGGKIPPLPRSGHLEGTMSTAALFVQHTGPKVTASTMLILASSLGSFIYTAHFHIQR